MDLIKEGYFGDVHIGGVLIHVICSYGMKTLEQNLEMNRKHYELRAETMVFMGYMKILYEESRKKNKNLKTKLKAEKFNGNLKMLYFAMSFMINAYLILKCNC